MKAEEIFQASVEVMKRILTSATISASSRRSNERSEKKNLELLLKERENVNELVRAIVEAGGVWQETGNAPMGLIDAMVIRYLRNREIFMKTFPHGIEEIDPDPVSIWAAIMISPHDEVSGEQGKAARPFS